MNYIGETCPVCGKKFTQDDDVVVCPVCGTPHHRECYNLHNACANEKFHSADFEWKPEAQPQAPKAFEEHGKDGAKTVVCPNCGRENPAEEPNCLYCSARLYNVQTPFPPAPNMPYGARVVEISPDDTIGSHKVSDVAAYVQVNANRYIPKFYVAEKTGRKHTFNWAAFFFSPYWFFFRKMNIIGFALLLVSLFTTGICTTPRFIERAQTYQTSVEQYQNGELSVEEMSEVSKEFMKTPEVIALAGVEFAIRLFGGIFGNSLYKKKIEKDLTDFKVEAQTDEEYRLRIMKRGGISMAMSVIAVFGYYCAEQLLLSFITRGN